MLPPVIAVPSSQISYQEQRPFIEIAGGGPQTAPPPQTVAPSALESAVAGRLNILLLTGRERMAENLALLAEMFGKAIGITRKEGETSLEFASRLADAIAALPLAQRVKLEGQLARALNGVQLRMLLASLKNPAGADAAKLSILIELARANERDLAARSVVTSYRQNAAEPGSEAKEQLQRAEKAAGAPAAATNSTPANTNAQQATTAAAQPTAPQQAEAASPEKPAAPTTSEQEQSAQGEPVKSANQETPAKTEMAVRPETGSAATAVSEQASRADMPAVAPASTPVEAVTISTGQDNPAVERNDAQGLQALLQRSFSDDGAITESRVASPTTANAPVAKAMEELARTEAAGEAMPADMEEYTPGIELRHAAAEPTVRASEQRPQTTLLVLKGWREVDNLLPIILDEAAEAPSRALVAQAIQAAGGPGRETDNIPSLPPAQSEAMEQAKRHAATFSLADGDLIQTGNRDGVTLRSFPEALLSQWRMLDEQMTALRPAIDNPNGAALPVVNYLFADDTDEGKPSEEAKRRHDEGGSGERGEQQASGEQGEGSREGAEDEAEGDLGAETDGSGLAADAERANDLYWRMAGWS